MWLYATPGFLIIQTSNYVAPSDDSLNQHLIRIFKTLVLNSNADFQPILLHEYRSIRISKSFQLSIHT